jgi:ATP-dependent protease ClpP protease subunit
MKTLAPQLRAGSDSVELLLYETEEKGLSVAEIATQLKAAGSKNVVVRIATEAGPADAGLAIYNILKAHPGKVTARIDGIAGAAASIVSMAASERLMFPSSAMVIRNPMMFARGEAKDMRRAADTLNRIAASMVDAYAERTGLPKAEIVAMMDGATYLTAQDAVAKGFATRILASTAGGEAATASAVSIPTAAWKGDRDRVALKDLNRYVGAFGPEAGIQYLRDGLTFAEAVTASGKPAGLGLIVRMAGDRPKAPPMATKGLASLVRIKA